jgi:hypothetical protein
MSRQRTKLYTTFRDCVYITIGLHTMSGNPAFSDLSCCPCFLTTPQSILVGTACGCCKLRYFNSFGVFDRTGSQRLEKATGTLGAIAAFPLLSVTLTYIRCVPLGYRVVFSE